METIENDDQDHKKWGFKDFGAVAAPAQWRENPKLVRDNAREPEESNIMLDSMIDKK
jgi:hypothetical protein